eukprot:scaffold234640_cov24-Tisochrysis_lutea.AAC.2
MAPAQASPGPPGAQPPGCRKPCAQVHYYIRAIQMEQLQQQDLTADMQQINDEISNAVKETQVPRRSARSPSPSCLAHTPPTPRREPTV